MRLNCGNLGVWLLVVTQLSRPHAGHYKRRVDGERHAIIVWFVRGTAKETL